MTTLDVLKRARDILASKRWTRGTYARDKKRHDCPADSPEAVSFCSIGALQAASGMGVDEAVAVLQKTLWTDRYMGLHCVSIAEWNDKPWRTKAQVLALFDKTIANWGKL